MYIKILNRRCNIIIYALFFIAVGIFSCRPARHLPDGEYLLDRYRIEAPSNNIDRDELRTYVRQKPNKRILGLRFHLWLYNIASQDKDSWLHNWLRRIGEEPVIYDSFVTRRSSGQIEQYLRNKGYYKAEVEDAVRLRRKRAGVTYVVEPGEPYHIAAVGYTFDDRGLQDIIIADSSNSLVRPGVIFDVDLLQGERVRIENYLKNRGYFNFSREHVYFNADTTLGDMSVDITIGISMFRKRQEDGQVTMVPHQRFNIGNIYIYPEFNPRAAIDRPDDYYRDFDTLVFREMHYLYRNSIPVSQRVIAQSNFILPGDLYNKENVDRTYRNFLELRQYRLVNVRFDESNTTFDEPHDQRSVPDDSLAPDYPESNDPSTVNHTLDARIQLTPFSMQSYTVEFEGTNSSGDFGFGGNISYQHRNIFGGAEIFDFRVRGSIETLSEYYTRSFKNTYEYGAEAGLQIPRFMLPIRSISFVRRYNPRTSLSMAYNYQLRPDYTRTIANVRFGYRWRGSEFITHLINPIELNLVRLPYSTPQFLENIRQYNLEASFRDHMVSETNYSLIFNNQDIRRKSDFTYFRFNTETAGNILAAISNAADRPREDGYYRLFGTGFAQYFKSDIDLRFYKILADDNTLVYRFFAGAGLPYGNSTAIPFEKKYFAGGANSIRAWQVRSLGPGSFYEPVERSFPNSTADIKLEANLEYRFELFWLIEGAMFLDAGNIWAIDDNDKREGALFKFDTFYNEIAVGTGIGLRFDFSFFVFRLDMGLKLRDPAEPADRRWIPLHRNFTYADDVAFNIGIGYPF